MCPLSQPTPHPGCAHRNTAPLALPASGTDPAKGSCHSHGIAREPQCSESSENNQIKRTVGHGCAASPMCSVGPAHPRAPHGLESKAEEGWVNQCCSGGVPWAPAHGRSPQSPPSWGRSSRGLLSHTLYFNTGSCCSPLGAAQAVAVCC